MERLYEHIEGPADTEEVTSSSGGDSFAIIGMGATGGVLVESLYKIGFDNVLLCGLADIKPINLPEQKKLVLTGEDPKDMQQGEAIAAQNQPKIYNAMRERLGRPGRIFLVVGADGKLSAGSTLVLLECAHALLKESKHESGQRVGVFVAYPTGVELQYSQAVKDATFLVTKLVEINQRKLFDPLIIGDRTNLCALLDSLSAPSEDQDGQTKDDQEATAPDTTEQPARGFGSSIYEE